MGTSDVEPVTGAATTDASQMTPALARVGKILRGKWHLDALLGVGGMAAVYAATHRNGTRAAVKVLHHHLSVDETFRRRFLREGQIANMVGHDGAVKVLDDDTSEDGSVYLVTELLEGETLEDRCGRCGGSLGEDEVLSIADQILDVLAAAHAKELVHRDLKPENIFLTRTGQVKVLDFGIARARALSSATTATRAGAMMGTPPYMAPEQARGLWDEVDGRTDLWACGATLFRLLTGRLVHLGRTTNEELLSAMTNPAPALSSVVPAVSPALARLVDRALAFDKRDRWPDAAAMQEAVRNAYVVLHATAIAMAPKLVVPAEAVHTTVRALSDLEDDAEIGMMPTLASSPGPGADLATGARSSTTSGPVSSSVTGTSPAGSSKLSRGTRWGLMALAATAACAAAWITLGRARPAALPTSAPPVAAAAAPPPAVSATATASAPEVAPPETSGTPALPPPSAAVSARAATTGARPSAAKVSAGRPAGDKPGCMPPYVVDSVTGKKNWKLECL